MLVETEMMENEPFYILESNETLEDRSKFLDDKQLNQVLGSHPKLADYQKISLEYPRSQLVKEYAESSPSSDIVYKAFIDRLMFLLVNPREKLFTYRFKPDVLLSFAKAIIIYRWNLSNKSSRGLNTVQRIDYICKVRNPTRDAEEKCFKPVAQFVDDEKSS